MGSIFRPSLAMDSVHRHIGIALLSLSDELEYAVTSGRTLSQQKLDDLYARLRATLANTNALWAEKRSKDQVAEQQKEGDTLPQSK
jgi:hypothetical protein